MWKKLKVNIIVEKSWKHCGKWRNFSLWAISPFATLFSKVAAAEVSVCRKGLNLFIVLQLIYTTVCLSLYFRNEIALYIEKAYAKIGLNEAARMLFYDSVKLMKEYAQQVFILLLWKTYIWDTLHEKRYSEVWNFIAGANNFLACLFFWKKNMLGYCDTLASS